MRNFDDAVIAAGINAHNGRRPHSELSVIIVSTIDDGPSFTNDIQRQIAAKRQPVLSQVAFTREAIESSLRLGNSPSNELSWFVMTSSIIYYVPQYFYIIFHSMHSQRYRAAVAFCMQPIPSLMHS